MNDIPDFTETKRWRGRSGVDERRGTGSVERHSADIELKLAPNAPHGEYPALFRHAGGCNFAVIDTGEGRLRARFFCAGLEQFRTGIDEFDNVADATVTLLRMQADYESVRSGAFPDVGSRSCESHNVEYGIPGVPASSGGDR